jgi:hypothetical protein
MDGSATCRDGVESLPSVFREQGIDIVADTVAEVVADDAYSIEPCHQGITIAGRQLGDDLQGLFEHADQCIEITVILIPDIVAEPCNPFAVEDHQLRETAGSPTALL